MSATRASSARSAPDHRCASRTRRVSRDGPRAQRRHARSARPHAAPAARSARAAREHAAVREAAAWSPGTPRDNVSKLVTDAEPTPASRRSWQERRVPHRPARRARTSPRPSRR
jgi:hypothetical protein